ncbi:MAG: glucose-6-phosphate isomerase, partial [Pseudomonadales bacterium]|nr:glucose-6-phosphate isomerase [Pseudomonadales bacterium]
GIGGSWLGPRMVAEALGTTHDGASRASWVANVDGQHIAQVLAESDPAETLLVVVSKTFTTTETMTNARTAHHWLLQQVPESELHRHLIGVTSNQEAARAFGIHDDNILPMADWIGGRYSLWSAVGITNAIIHGMDAFHELLDGARTMDDHFLNSPVRCNMPVLLAMIGVWYHNFHDVDSHAVIPYDHALRLLPDHLQQLDMESNGKTVTEDGKPVRWKTGPIVWGGEGTNGQHAFHQLLHQGSRPVSLDFIVPLTPNHDLRDHHDLLVAHCPAQSQALMTGRTIPDAPHRTMPGNRPSNLILMDRLTPRTLGSLIALYEHKVFTQARIWQINPFDQWGVELGKAIASDIHDRIAGAAGEPHPDPVTQALIERYKNAR